MRILLTGGTGYIGSAVLEELVAAGHELVAVVRSEGSARLVSASGAEPRQGDLTDVDWLATQLAAVDAAIHTAVPDAGADAFNAAVVDAVIRAFSGTSRRFVLTSGVWEYGAGVDLQDDGPLDPPELVAWRVAIEERLLRSNVDATVLAPGVVYGRGRGLVSLILDAPRAEDGRLELIGDGEQHWTWVHVDDLARLYRVVVEHPASLGRIIGSDGTPTSVRAIAESVVGTGRVVPRSADAARERFGAAFADALLLDERAHGAKARALGWVPEHTSVLEELADEASAA